MKITKNHLRRIIKEEIANVLEKASDKDLEEGWWPFGKEKESPIQKRLRLKREKAAFEKEKEEMWDRVNKAGGWEPDGTTRTADKEAIEAQSARNQARYDAEQKEKRQKEMDAEYDKQQEKAKRKEAEKNKIEYWEFKDGRGGMSVRVNNAKDVAEFHRANGSEIPEWALRALNEKRIQTRRIIKRQLKKIIKEEVVRRRSKKTPEKN